MCFFCLNLSPFRCDTFYSSCYCARYLPGKTRLSITHNDEEVVVREKSSSNGAVEFVAFATLKEEDFLKADATCPMYFDISVLHKTPSLLNKRS